MRKFVGKSLAAFWGHLGKIPSNPQKVACSYTYGRCYATLGETDAEISLLDTLQLVLGAPIE